MLRISLNQLPTPQVRTVKRNDQLILPLLPQRLRHIDPIGQEHIIRLQNRGPIEHDRSKCIQPVKCQHGLRALRDLLARKRGPVGPTFLADPLNYELIFANEGIGDQTVV